MTLAAPIIPASELTNQVMASGLAGCAAAIGNLTHQLELDRPIYWCVTQSSTINAMVAAYSNPDMYCVVIARGTINTLHHFAAGILVDEQLRDFLSTSSEAIDEGSEPERSRREAWLKVADDAKVNATRASIESAVPVTFVALYFLMAHEVGHLVGGHLPLCRGGFAAEASSKAAENFADSRTLERDADALAANATVYLLGNEDFRESWADILTDPQSAFRYFFVSTYILFSVMDIFGPEGEFDEHRTHPPSMVRVSTTSAMLSVAVDFYGGFTKDEIWEIGRSAVRSIEIAVMTLGQGMMTAEEVETLEPMVLRNLEEHEARWEGLRNSLDRKHLEKYWWSQPFR